MISSIHLCSNEVAQQRVAHADSAIVAILSPGTPVPDYISDWQHSLHLSFRDMEQNGTTIPANWISSGGFEVRHARRIREFLMYLHGSQDVHQIVVCCGTEGRLAGAIVKWAAKEFDIVAGSQVSVFNLTVYEQLRHHSIAQQRGSFGERMFKFFGLKNESP